MLPPDLGQTLCRLTHALADAQDDWWIIGSAAVALHGALGLTVADVDVVLSEADARRILPALGLDPLPGGASTLFRSMIFAAWHDPPLTVEFMAGFEAHLAGGWTPVRPATRQRIAIDDVDVFVPGRTELLALLTSFDRPKDRDRARLLSVVG